MYERVDPDALAQPLEHSTDHLSVSFEYAGYRITVADVDQIEFDPQSNATTSD
ncbi:HalOD1 output domain-containing protein [Natronococcus zhouii]|uniref:HalOD1 output domain-containing protein n=1 Tax=Natronococcus zhouii TaxID=2951804 RepID=UPI00207CEFFE|nr:HalOD1 output domain-containing protein [Natronococcus sp. CG52]